MKFAELVKYIRTYESDTFSAEGSGLTHSEAVKLAEGALDMLVNNYLDGVTLDASLFEMRE